MVQDETQCRLRKQVAVFAVKIMGDIHVAAPPVFGRLSDNGRIAAPDRIHCGNISTIQEGRIQRARSLKLRPPHRWHRGTGFAAVELNR